MFFKTIERRDGEGNWRRFEFADLKAGDVFRVVDGLIKGENPGPWVCHSDATPIPNEPENWCVNVHPE